MKDKKIQKIANRRIEEVRCLEVKVKIRKESVIDC